MGTRQGACTDCGRYVEKYVKPGRELRCLDCGIKHQADFLRSLADGTAPDLPMRRALGAEQAAQIRAKKGPHYEKWLAGQIRRLQAELAAAGLGEDQAKAG